MELRDVVMILRRRKGIILIAVAVAVVIAVLAVLLSQKQYSSTATIEVNKDNGNGLGMVDFSGITSGLGGDNQINMDLLTEQAVIMSDNTALSVIERLKLDAHPPYAIPEKVDKDSPLGRERGVPLEKAPIQRERLLAIFRNRLHVSLIKGTRLIGVTYTDTDPARSTAIANAVVEAYINEYTEERYQASSRVSSWLADQLEDLKDKVSESQTKVEDFQRQSGLTGMTMMPGMEKTGGTPAVPSSDNVPLERLLELNRNLTAAEVTRISKEAIYHMTETQDPDVVLGIGTSELANGLSSDSPVAPGSADLTLLQQLRQQEAQVKVQIATASTKYGAKNPAMVQLQDEYDTLEKQIHTELERIRTRAKNDLDLAMLAEQGIRQQIAAQEQEVNKVSEKADQLVLLQEEALSSREIYQDLYTKLEEASVTAGIRASNITLVNPARVPSMPSSPKGKLTVALGAMLGLVFGLVGAFSWDYFDDSITGPEQVEQITPVPVVGAIPDFGGKQSVKAAYRGSAKEAPEESGLQPTAWLLRAPRSHIAEAYRTLRTALLMSRADHPPKTMLIMSGSPDEGKSTTCLNTATAFAMQGDRVLYLDGDLRRARAHLAFRAGNEEGLSNCLTGNVPYQKALKPYPGIDNLLLLPAGPHPPNPAELIGSKRFVDLLAELKKDFDYIFIDSPPVLLVTDAQILSQHVDGFVMVVRSNKTTKRALQRSLMLMRTAGAAPLGIVVNVLNAALASYSGYEYYGKGGGYYVDAE